MIRYRRYYPNFHQDGSVTVISHGWWFGMIRFLFWPLFICLGCSVILALAQGNIQGAGILFLLFAILLPSRKKK